ncbi:hypothetical protein ACED29_17480 [Shewanella sp. 5S214]|uniref:hypothetical protein n=1 Tax=Shewanella sp. 5S214 TaxID=3229999 RepID=UPI00352E7174
MFDSFEGKKATQEGRCGRKWVCFIPRVDQFEVELLGFEVLNKPIIAHDWQAE